MSFQTDKLHRILFIDIETATVVPQFEDLDIGLKEHWQKRFDRYLQYSSSISDELTPEVYFVDKAAIFAEFAKVICISVGYIRGVFPDHEIRVKTFNAKDEFELLTDFSDLLHHFYFDRYNHSICGHNVREFDIPFLCRRMIINQMRLPNLMNISGLKPWQVTHIIDTLDMWKFGDYKHYTSLDLLCQVLGIESPKQSISGKDVSKLYWQGELTKISKYCEDDVRATIEVYLRCVEFQGLIGTKQDNAEEE